MWNSLWCHQHNACRHRDLLTLKQKLALSLNDLVDLVHAGMRMERVFLSRFETIEADQNALGFEKCGFAHFFGSENCVVFRSDRYRVIHRTLVLCRGDAAR